MNLRTRILWWLVIAVGLPVLGTGISQYHRVSRGVGDFEDIYQASRAAIDTHRLSTAHPNSIGLYPPSGRPILMLQALLPAIPAAMLWFCIYTAFYLLACYLAARYIAHLESPHWFAGMMAMWLLSLPWILSDLAVGNVSSILVICGVGSYVLASRGRTWLAAFVLSLAIAIKILPAMLLGYYLWRRRWAMIAATAVCTLAVGILPGLAWFGPRNFVESWPMWARERMQVRTPAVAVREHQLVAFNNQSVIATLTRLFTDADAGREGHSFRIGKSEWSAGRILTAWACFMTLPILLWTAMAWNLHHQPPPDDSAEPLREGLRYAFFMLAMVWVSPQVFSYYMAWIALPAGLLGMSAFQHRLIGQRDRFSEWILTCYVLTFLTLGSPWLRAHGTYLLGILLIATGVCVATWHRQRHPAALTEMERRSPAP